MYHPREKVGLRIAAFRIGAPLQVYGQSSLRILCHFLLTRFISCFPWQCDHYRRGIISGSSCKALCDHRTLTLQRCMSSSSTHQVTHMHRNNAIVFVANPLFLVACNMCFHRCTADHIDPNCGCIFATSSRDRILLTWRVCVSVAGVRRAVEGEACGDQVWHRGAPEERRRTRVCAPSGDEPVRQALPWDLHGRVPRDAARLPQGPPLSSVRLPPPPPPTRGGPEGTARTTEKSPPRPVVSGRRIHPFTYRRGGRERSCG